MKRRNFLQKSALAGTVALTGLSGRTIAAALPLTKAHDHPPGNSRVYWIELLHRIAGPVLENLAQGTLKQNMPLETAPGYSKKVEGVTYLEAFGRAAAGLAPWLGNGIDDSPEGRLRSHYIQLFRQGLENGVAPKSPDYLGFDQKMDAQLLVDAAFLAQAFIRAPEQLWNPLPDSLKQAVVRELKQLQWIKPGYNNWLLFAAIIEAFYLMAGEEWDPMRIDYALRKMEDWYKGDGWYGDGPAFHFDYYNDYVILPMLLDILQVMVQQQKTGAAALEKILKRAQRHAEIQERLIAPDGTYPIVGRSAPYRNAAFQNLAWLAWQEQLPESLQAGQVRAALTATMQKIYEHPGTFDSNGWLQLGVCGHQPEIADTYTSTGSLYLCTNAFLPLGLPAEHPFWTVPDEEWTSVKVWSGKTVQKDHAIAD